MALPQWHMAQRGSRRAASSKACAASSYWKECISATPRSMSGCASRVADVGKLTAPGCPAAAREEDPSATRTRTRKTAEADDFTPRLQTSLQPVRPIAGQETAIILT